MNDNWLERIGRKAEERLRAMDPKDLGPAGRLLMGVSNSGKCKYCDQEIHGGKGDWWHVDYELGGYGKMQGEDGHLAYPKEEPVGGPWTKHGHAVEGVTVEGSGRPPVARCGGPMLCSSCALDAARIRHDFAIQDHTHPEPTAASDDMILAIWRILDETDGSEAWVHDLVRNGIISWRAIQRQKAKR